MNYTGITKGIMGYPRYNVMKHLINKDNISLCTCRQQSTFDFQHIFVADTILDMCYISSQTKEGCYVFPLYLYHDTSEQSSFFEKNRKPNMNIDIVEELEEKLGLRFTPEKEETEKTFAPIDILDYIYGVLHSNKYREKYKEFLKIDFPRIPYPSNADYFFNIGQLGKQLRGIHLLEAPIVNEFMTSFPVSGNSEVESVEYKDSKVYINKTQYFDKVPQIAWDFYIGGYQPAQKWLKDRKGRILSYEEIFHYQKIIVALVKTFELMQKIDEVIEV